MAIFIIIKGILGPRKNRREGIIMHKQRMKKRWKDNYFLDCNRNMRFSWIVSIVFNICIIHVLFRRTDFAAISFIIAAIILVKEIYRIYFMHCLEKGIVYPLNKLQKGFEEVMNENYGVKIEHNIDNKMGILIYSFNKMTSRLQEGEKIKSEYEENRKMLIASITHDLRTPIASIQGYAEAILDEVVASPEKTKKYLEIILNNSNYMNNLIEDLFLFTKLDMDRLEFEYEDTAISLYMNDLMEELKIEVEEHGVIFEYKNELEKEYILRIDGKKIYRAIMNIVNNSLRYAERVDLLIKTVLFEEKGYVGLQIADNGIGIPENKVKRIFERFYRVDSERTKDFVSSGLGLPIAKELVEIHGGRIEVCSEEGNGASFTIFLPITEE